MSVYGEDFRLKTKGFADVHDITPRLNRALAASGLREGIMVASLSGSTGGITTIEYEPGVVEDLKELLERLIPQSKSYHHDATWGDANGFAHLRSALVGTSLSIPFSAGKLALGTWQQVVFIDFDNRPRERTLHVQLVGSSD
jgi:secondary thiamine-phosphate synthase enzyme